MKDEDEVVMLRLLPMLLLKEETPGMNGLRERTMKVIHLNYQKT